MNKPKAIVIILISLILAGFAGYKLYGQKETGITATGTVEVTQVDITPKTGGSLKEFTLTEGDRITAGQKVALISRPDLEAQVLRDKASYEKALAQLKDLEDGSRSQERLQAAAALASAQAVYGKANTNFKRYQTLFQSGAATAQQLDEAQTTNTVAYNAVVSAQQSLSLLQAGSRPETIAAQKEEVNRNKAILTASQAVLGDTTVKVPLSGTVLTKNYENGEYVNPGTPIATVGNMQDCWVKIYVASDQMGLIKANQAVKVKIDSFPNKVFHGKIKSISQNAEFTPRQSITQRERANLVFAVKVKLDNTKGILKPGMPADVVIQ